MHSVRCKNIHKKDYCSRISDELKKLALLIKDENKKIKKNIYHAKGKVIEFLSQNGYREKNISSLPEFLSLS